MEPIGYRIKEISRLFGEVVKNKVLKSGMSVTQFHIIKYLDKNKNLEITQKDICDFLRMKAPTISITLSNLEDDNLIVRKKSLSDNRKTIISLTNKGEEQSKKFKSLFKEVDNLMESVITKEELEVFYLALDKMKEALERVK